MKKEKVSKTLTDVKNRMRWSNIFKESSRKKRARNERSIIKNNTQEFLRLNDLNHHT